MSVEVNQSLSLTVSPACTDLVPFVPAEVALGLHHAAKRPAIENGLSHKPASKQGSSLERVNGYIQSHVLSFLDPVQDLPAFACASKVNQSQAVSCCLRGIRGETHIEPSLIWPQAIIQCRGKKSPLSRDDLLSMQGACKALGVDDISPFLGNHEQNEGLAQKLPHVLMFGCSGPTPNLTPFALHCSKLRALAFDEGTLSGEEHLEHDFPSLISLEFTDCARLTDAGLEQLLRRSPKIKRCTISPPEAQTPRMREICEAAANGSLNQIIHGKKESKSNQ